jgi:threonine/homoserine/homoserine lactone efflux protein
MQGSLLAAFSLFALRRFLRHPRRLRLFNWSMAALLVLSLYPLLTRR